MEIHKLKIFIGRLAMCLLVTSVLFGVISQTNAQSNLLERVTSDRKSLNCSENADCITAGGASAASGFSTALAVKKYQEAKSLENSHSKVLMESLSGDKPDSFRSTSLLSSVQDGDKVVVHYRLSYQENRQYHIGRYESMADSADSMADYHSSQAVAAAIPKPVTHVDEVKDAQGNVISRNVRTTWEVDHAAVAMHSAQASSQRSSAREHRREANAVRSGEKQAPIYDFEEKIEDAAGNRQKAMNVISERVGRNGTITKVTRLPAEIFAQLKKTIRVARGGVAGAALMGVVAAEEAIVGAGARAIERAQGSRGWSPASRNSLTAK
jgi:hypothetical protein